MDKKVRAIDITFSNLTYSVAEHNSKEKKDVLKSISGKFKSGELTAIMGPSGAGKSSLLNILTGFTKNGVDGNIRFGPYSKGKNLCSYILQEDHFFPWFTVEESMFLAATLKISNKSMNIKERQLLIENILETLKLTNSKKTKCSNLSGGQCKRLSIALELLDNTPVLFLDEPTTGLDSSASADCINLLKNLCSEGRTIVCTIHQPSSSIYHEFNHVYVLNKGYCVYQGSPRNTVKFFKDIGLQCPQYHNPADFLLEVVNCEYGDYTHEMAKLTQESNWRYDLDTIDTHTTSDTINLQQINSNNLNESNTKISINESENSWKNPKNIYPPSEWMRLWILIGRCHVQFFRDWTVTHLKLALHILCSILIGFLYGDSGTNATKAIANVSLLLVGIVYLWYTTMMPGVLKFPLEIATIRKETFNNWYKLRTYYLATLITSTPVHILFSTVFSTIIYYLTKQPLELETYVKVAFIYIILTIAADGFGILLGTLANPVNGTFWGAVLTCFMIIYSGFLILFDHMSSFMRVISYTSAHRYALESIIISVYDDETRKLICPEEQIYCHLRDPHLVKQSLGMLEGSYNFNVLMLILQISLFKGAAYFTLRRALKSA